MKKLDLILKAKWYDLIECGAKTEEYREITPYWINRLCEAATDSGICSGDCRNDVEIRHFDEVCFHRGYTKTTMLFQVKDITIGRGEPEWGAPEKEVFIIKLGERC